MWKRLRNRRTLGDAYKSVFSTPEGQLVLDDLLFHGKVLEAASGETEEGMRRLALHILSMINWKTVDLNSKLQEIVRDE